MDNSSPKFRLDISPNGPGYKSIQKLTWESIPDFAIVTGRNGSGKTQLLEILSYHFTGTRPAQSSWGVSIATQGVTLDADEVGFVPSTGRFSGGNGASISQMQNYRQNFYQQVQHKHNHINDPFQMARTRRAEKRLNGRNWQTATQSGQLSLADDEFDDFFVDVDVSANLALIFVDYNLKRAEALMRKEDGLSNDGKELGPAPWDVVNDSLLIAGFPYEVTKPMGRLTDHYSLLLKDRTTGIEIRPSDLSSGEQVLLQLTLWLFSSGKPGVFPKLLLLDEPDAHLHPSMTNQFLNVISEVLVRKHGVKVIMTTHSPSTVALAPEGSIFQMDRGEPEIRPVADRASILSVLTAGLITVSRATRFCFVEDEEDVDFYNAVLDVLTDRGPSKDPCAILPSPSLVFIAASVGRGASKIAGGETIVRKWIEKLDAAPLTTTFLGLIDQDNGNTPSARIKVIGRYSFENYLLDPVNVFALQIENANAPYVEGVAISSGDEHQLRHLSAEALQGISDAITSRVEALEPKLMNGARTAVTYTTGQAVQLPQWMINCRGHELLQLYQKAWGGVNHINQLRLIKVLRRVRLIPQELATLYADLQS